MVEFFRKNSTSISIGLISAVIFLYILQPMLEFFGNKIVSVGTCLGASYVDEIYAQVSHLEIMDFGFLLFSLFIITPVAFMTGLTISLFFKKVDVEKNDVVDKKEILPITLRKKILLILLLLIFHVLLLSIISTKAYQLSLVSSFKQHMRVVAPYIEAQEEEILFSKWSLIKNKSDYEEVYFMLENIAEKNDIKLPENKIYSLTSI